MELRVPMGVRRAGIAVSRVFVAMAAPAPGSTAKQDSAQNSNSSSSSEKPSQTKSPSPAQKARRHHTTVAEEEGPQPELAKAEAFIQQKDFAQAEPLLQKL